MYVIYLGLASVKVHPQMTRAKRSLHLGKCSVETRQYWALSSEWHWTRHRLELDKQPCAQLCRNRGVTELYFSIKSHLESCLHWIHEWFSLRLLTHCGASSFYCFRHGLPLLFREEREDLISISASLRNSERQAVPPSLCTTQEVPEVSVSAASSPLSQQM